MAISITKYIDITSGVGGNVAVQQRELIGRLITDNNLVPTNSYIEFTSAADVGAYFGKSSTEYLRAVYYFSFINKMINAADKISFARWVDADVAPIIFGSKITTSLATFQGIANGAFQLTIGATTNTISTLDFTSATSLADVASVIKDGINAETGVQWTDATVVYNSTTGSFNFVGGDDTVPAVISASNAMSGTQILNLIGWGTGAIFSNGALTQSITDMLNATTGLSDNFGSFCFIPVLTLDQITEAATWNDSQNNLYQYHVPVPLASDNASYSAALLNYSGVGLTESLTAGEYPEQLPMMILAATDYNARNAVQNYMFVQSNLTPSVSDTTTSNLLDSLRINYYGVTQTAGQFLAFYQRGYLMGGSTAAIDMGTYANEQWLKSAMLAQLMSVFLSLSEVSANNAGKIQILTSLQEVIDQALVNGTISVGKDLNNSQKLFITQVTGDPDAFYQVQNSGYWLDAVIQSYVNNSITEYKIVYTLVYSKNDVIRSIDGTHILI